MIWTIICLAIGYFIGRKVDKIKELVGTIFSIGEGDK